VRRGHEVHLCKTKIGFGSPMADWFNDALQSWIQATINSPAFLQSDLWDGPRVRRYIQKRTEQGWLWADTERIWPILHAHLWEQMFLHRRQPESLVVD
jgi:hypothetical protein